MGRLHIVIQLSIRIDKGLWGSLPEHNTVRGEKFVSVFWRFPSCPIGKEKGKFLYHGCRWYDTTCSTCLIYLVVWQLPPGYRGVLQSDRTPKSLLTFICQGCIKVKCIFTRQRRDVVIYAVICHKYCPRNVWQVNRSKLRMLSSLHRWWW